MPRHKQEEEVTEEEVTVEEEVSTGSASVYSRNGSLVRTYTSELHGKDYKSLAKGYSGKIGGTVK